ncbi:hypothetical protein Tco_0929211 [Tanacetum coccineum]
MANLEFCDKHNMVAYLKKPSGSEGFQEIVDFLNGSYIRYALTKNPTIYVSLIEKFWQTATVRTVDNGEQEITATVDGKEFTVTEAYVRRHLQLADVDGINVLPTTKFFYQLSLMGSKRVPTPPCDSPLLRVYTLGSDEGSMTLQELTVLCTTLSKKVESLEADLKQTKQVYGAAYTKLIMRVKKLEKTIKISHSRRRAKIVVLDEEEDSEDSSKQGRMIEEINQDARITLVTPTHGEDQPEDQLGVLSAAKVLADAAKTNIHIYTRRKRAVSTGSGGISTVGASMPKVSYCWYGSEVNICIPSTVIVKDKRLGHEAAVRLQEELDEEERQRMARVHEAAQSFTEEEWENIRARVEADEELSKRLQAEERNKYSKVDQAKILVDLINQRKKYFAAQKFEAKRNKPMTQA